MTDDIVTRLREEFCNHGLWENACLPDDKCPCCLAADEIERLREENDKASALIAKLAELLLPYSMLTNKHEQELLVKAVRGD